MAPPASPNRGHKRSEQTVVSTALKLARPAGIALFQGAHPWNAAMEHYHPHAAPDPKEWLALDEDDRLDLVSRYHEHAGIPLARVDLHSIAHVVVENQIALGDELPVKRTLRRLMDEGLDRHDAVHAIGSVLTGVIYDISRDTLTDADPNPAYFAKLERLTAADWLGSAEEATGEEIEALRILEDLGAGQGLPVDAIRAADADRASMVPLFLRAIEQYVAGESSPSTELALFFVFHLLGQWREKSAYRPLAELLRLPADQTEGLFANATTETTHRVMAAVFDGDPKPLYDVILDRAADEFVRSRMCETVAMVTLRGELPRTEAARFLHACYSEIRPQDECFVWHGWQSAIAMLGLVELKPLVDQAFRLGYISQSWLSFQHFENDLQSARFPEDEFSLFGNTIEELSRWYCFGPEYEKRQQRHTGDWEVDDWTPQPPAVPAVNPFKDVGRNDPCPCGSGKKFKKCCLRNVA
jgi:hypothetical protein